MSTRSNIAVERANGQVMDIYCHSGGYLEGVGLTLFTSYPKTKDALQLTRLGDVSSLGQTPDSGSTFAYARDRGEKNVAARTHPDLASYLTQTEDDSYRQGWGYEYCYLLTRKSGWLVKQYSQPWEPLHTALITEALIEA